MGDEPVITIEQARAVEQRLRETTFSSDPRTFMEGAITIASLITELEAAQKQHNPRCKACEKWRKEQADNTDWIEGVKRGKEICKKLADAAIAAAGGTK